MEVFLSLMLPSFRDRGNANLFEIKRARNTVLKHCRTLKSREGGDCLNWDQRPFNKLGWAAGTGKSYLAIGESRSRGKNKKPHHDGIRACSAVSAAVAAVQLRPFLEEVSAEIPPTEEESEPNGFSLFSSSLNSA